MWDRLLSSQFRTHFDKFFIECYRNTASVEGRGVQEEEAPAELLWAAIKSSNAQMLGRSLAYPDYLTSDLIVFSNPSTSLLDACRVRTK